MTPPDLIVVGGGPAGMAAAATALDGGLRVILLDGGHTLGGQFWRHPPIGAADRLPVADLHHGLETYRALGARLDDAATTGQLDLRLGHQVWSVERIEGGFRVHTVDRTGPGERAMAMAAPALLIATGAHDRALPFPGWELPGVMTAGGLQALLKGGGSMTGRRVIVGGTGPFLLPVATGLAARGATVIAVCEGGGFTGWARQPRALAANPGKLGEGLGYAREVTRHRIPIRRRTAVVAAHGTDRVEAVTIARLDLDGAIRPGSGRRVAVDLVGVSWGFVPQLDLAITLGARLRAAADGNRVIAVDGWQRTTIAGLYAAGESCGVGGADLAVAEGQLAAEAVLRDRTRERALPRDRSGDGALPREDHREETVRSENSHDRVVATAQDLARLRTRIARQRRFADAMHRAHPIPTRWTDWLEPSTIICRCEEVDLAAVRAADAGDARQLKQLTRTGMGWCQGRICGFAADCLTAGSGAASGPTERLITTPVTLGALAGAHTTLAPARVANVTPGRDPRGADNLESSAM